MQVIPGVEADTAVAGAMAAHYFPMVSHLRMGVPMRVQGGLAGPRAINTIVILTEGKNLPAEPIDRRSITGRDGVPRAEKEGASRRSKCFAPVVATGIPRRFARVALRSRDKAGATLYLGMTTGYWERAQCASGDVASPGDSSLRSE